MNNQEKDPINSEEPTIAGVSISAILSGERTIEEVSDLVMKKAVVVSEHAPETAVEIALTELGILQIVAQQKAQTDMFGVI